MRLPPEIIVTIEAIGADEYLVKTAQASQTGRAALPGRRSIERRIHRRATGEFALRVCLQASAAERECGRVRRILYEDLVLHNIEHNLDPEDVEISIAQLEYGRTQRPRKSRFTITARRVSQ